MKQLKKLYRRLFPQHRYHLIPRELQGCCSVLDLGCGATSPIHFCNHIKISVGVDLWDFYLAENRKNNLHSVYVKADIKEIGFKPKSFDAVLCSEVLEHLPKEDGRFLGYVLVQK